MKKVFYTRANCPEIPEKYNKGNAVEWKVGYELTGIPSKANNRPAEMGGDVLDWQVKSPKASLTEKDNCNGYIFGFADTDFFYEMSTNEFENFVNNFSYIDRDSRSGKEKIRIKSDSKKMREWLEERV